MLHDPLPTRMLKLPLASAKLMAMRWLPALLVPVAGRKSPGNPILELLASTTLPEILAVEFVSVRLVLIV